MQPRPKGPSCRTEDGAVLTTVSYADVLLLDSHEQIHASRRRHKFPTRHTQRNHHVIECGAVVTKEKTCF